MMKFSYSPVKEPTFYYIGVSTGRSSIMRVYPKWAEFLGISDSFIGIDCRIHSEPKIYRKIVKFIKEDKKSLGALVTSHKIDLYNASKDLFNKVGDYTKLLDEISCISKRDDQLWGHAKDPITSGLALDSFIPKNHWQKTNAEMLIIGAGGASLALTTYIMQELRKNNLPSKIYVVNRSKPRLAKMKKIHDKINPGINVVYIENSNPKKNDEIVGNLKQESLIINGTGAGKDFPGSPLSNEVVFPKKSFVWDYNYRGNLVFLEQAKKQQNEKDLHIEDGWVYFLHGWSRVIAEVFHIDIPTSGPKFEKLSRIAQKVR